jgi:hypothetical protein
MNVFTYGWECHRYLIKGVQVLKGHDFLFRTKVVEKEKKLCRENNLGFLTDQDNLFLFFHSLHYPLEQVPRALLHSYCCAYCLVSLSCRERRGVLKRELQPPTFS